MADVIETPLRLFAELTTTGALAGKYQLEFQRRVEVDGKEVVPAAHMSKDITPEEGAAILESEAASLAAQVQALSQQVAAQQMEIAAMSNRALTAEAAAATLMATIREADRSWDEKVAPLINPQETVQ